MDPGKRERQMDAYHTGETGVENSQEDLENEYP